MSSEQVEDAGITNMNTADAPGDAYFGLSQLLLPYLCTGPEAAGVWCANRKWLSGGSTWMLYRLFSVEVRQPFGVYTPCNPDPKTGVFSCGPITGGNGLPKSCAKYEAHHMHYLAGSPFLKIPLRDQTVGECCSQCNAVEKAGNVTCDGWQLWNATGPTSNATGDATQCVLIKDGSILPNPNFYITVRKFVIFLFFLLLVWGG